MNSFIFVAFVALAIPTVFGGKLFGENSILTNEDLTAQMKPVVKEATWSAEIGSLCQFSNETLTRPGLTPDTYIECYQPKTGPSSKMQWSDEWMNYGIYTLRRCKGENTVFYFLEQKCRSKSYIRRQAVKCSSNSDDPSCPKTTDPSRRVRMQQCNTCGAQPVLQPVYQPAPAPQPIYQPPPPVFQPQQSGCGCATTSSGACPCPGQQPYIQPQPVIQPQPYIPQPQIQSSGCGCQPQQQGCSCNQQPVSTCGAQCGGQTSCCQQVVQQPQPCPNAQSTAANAQVGTSCSWQLEPLARDPSSRTQYLQCLPQPGGGDNYCGQWCSRPCAPGTQFDTSTQVCIRIPGLVPRAPIGGGCGCGQQQVSIGGCNSANQCPGQATCQVTQTVLPSQQVNSCSSCCVGGQSYGK